jgi:hypothetical protein
MQSFMEMKHIMCGLKIDNLKFQFTRILAQKK